MSSKSPLGFVKLITLSGIVKQYGLSGRKMVGKYYIGIIAYLDIGRTTYSTTQLPSLVKEGQGWFGLNYHTDLRPPLLKPKIGGELRQARPGRLTDIGSFTYYYPSILSLLY